MKALKFESIDAESHWTTWDRGARIDIPEIKGAGSYSTYCSYKQMDVPRLSKTGIPEDLVKRSIQSALILEVWLCHSDKRPGDSDHRVFKRQKRIR